MGNLRRGFERFCYRNRDKGIPNLMLYIVLGNALVFFMSRAAGNYFLYNLLCFDRTLILTGQVWRLFTYAFTFMSSSVWLTAISLYCFYSIGRAAETSIGTFRFNLYYFTGIILQDIFCMITGTPATISDLNFSLLLVFATQYPDFTIRLYFIVPIKAWVLVLIDLGITAYNIIALQTLFPHNLFPLVAIANYLLFFGNDAINLLPMSWRAKVRPKKIAKTPGVTVLRTGMDYRPSPAKTENYTHRCTVCGRTDVSNPELEFRYCSRCKGYYCYCEEHISNHEHIE